MADGTTQASWWRDGVLYAAARNRSGGAVSLGPWEGAVIERAA